MSSRHLELAFAASLTGFVFLAITLSIMFWTIHREIIRAKPEKSIPDGHPSFKDALSLALLPLELGWAGPGPTRRLWISPSRKTRIIRYGVDNDVLVSEGETMDEAVQAMLWNSTFRELKKTDDAAQALYDEYG